LKENLLVTVKTRKSRDRNNLNVNFLRWYISRYQKIFNVNLHLQRLLLLFSTTANSLLYLATYLMNQPINQFICDKGP